MNKLLESLISINTKVLILGFGKEGRSTYNFLRQNFPNRQLAIADINSKIALESQLKNDTKLTLITDTDYLNCLDDYDVIIKSPGVKIVNPSKKISKKLTSQTDLFLQCYAKQVIGVTGTKGKSTTVSLMKHFVEADNKKVMLLGNIGVPAFDMIDKIENDTIIIYELSAHQLEYISRSPHISVLLNVFPEHLDYFDNYTSYQNAKYNIFSYQNKGDVLIIHESLHFENGLIQEGDNDLLKKIIKVSDNELEFQVNNSPLLGSHNLVNINIALLAVKEVGVDLNVAINSLKGFVSLPHRLELIGEFRGIKFVNDSISTVPQSTIAAVNTLNNVDTLILGGYDRGLDYTAMIDLLAKTNISNFIFMGKAGERMLEYFSTVSHKNLITASSLESIFQKIVAITSKGSICLLSPAAASYDQFNNFEHRGDVFRTLIKKL